MERRHHRWRAILRTQHHRHDEAETRPPLSTSQLVDGVASTARQRAVHFMQSPEARAAFVALRTVGTLWESQTEGVAFMARLEASGTGGLIADEMRLGKTRMLLHHVLEDLQRRVAAGASRFTGQPTLICVRKGLVGTWLNEFVAHFGPLNDAPLRLVVCASGLTPDETGDATLVASGTSAHTLVHTTDVVLTTYPTLQLAESGRGFGMLRQIQWRRVIADEAHTFCGGGVDAVLFSAMTHMLRAQYKWFVSGTYVQNATVELQRVLEFVGVPTRSIEEAAERVAALYIRRQKLADATRAPDDVRDLRLAYDTPAEARLYQTMDRVLRHAARASVASMMQLRQLCLYAPLVGPAVMDMLGRAARVTLEPPPAAHAYLLCEALVGAALVPPAVRDAYMPADETTVLPPVLTKERLVLTYVRTQLPPGEKLIIACSWVTMLVRLAGLFDLRAQLLAAVTDATGATGTGATGEYVMVHGKSERRDEALTRFRTDPAVRVLFITTDTGHLGLDLTAASHIILLNPCWNPFKEEQMFERMRGVKQTRPLHILRLIMRDTFEEYLVGVADSKRRLSELLPTQGRVALSSGRAGGGTTLLAHYLHPAH